MKPNQTGLKRILKAFTYSFAGFKESFKTEAAFRQDLLFVFGALLLLFALPFYGIELAYMIFCLFFILIMELVNTALEAAIDRIGEEIHPLSKKTKDIGSLLVLLAFLNFFISGALLLF
ncbi:MAG: diacylglycerol kinase [Alphaproteobacteria bacterium]|nr:diacylglycerol kinase [Alphaproteobacteria bacterium]